MCEGNSEKKWGEGFLFEYREKEGKMLAMEYEVVAVTRYCAITGRREWEGICKWFRGVSERGSGLFFFLLFLFCFLFFSFLKHFHGVYLFIGF